MLFRKMQILQRFCLEVFINILYCQLLFCKKGGLSTSFSYSSNNLITFPTILLTKAAAIVYGLAPYTIRPATSPVQNDIQVMQWNSVVKNSQFIFIMSFLAHPNTYSSVIILATLTAVNTTNIKSNIIFYCVFVFPCSVHQSRTFSQKGGRTRPEYLSSTTLVLVQCHLPIDCRDRLSSSSLSLAKAMA